MGPLTGAERAKADIRRRVLEAIERPVVFDAFAGAGVMHEAVWHEADGYVGCDTAFFRDGRVAFVADNRRVMRAIGLEGFNVFDFDADDCPWEQVLILARRRPALRAGERLGLALSVLAQPSRDDGTAGKRKGEISRALSVLSGVAAQPGLERIHERIVDRALRRAAEMTGGRIERRWQAAGTGRSKGLYLGLVIAARTAA